MQERADGTRRPSPAPYPQPLRLTFVRHLPLHRGGKRWGEARPFVPRLPSKKKRVYGRNMVPPVRSRAARGAVPQWRFRRNARDREGAAVCGDRGGLMKRGPRSACAVGHSSTFHRRKVDRKAAGGPLYQRRNAPRTPRSPTQRMASAAPQPRVCRGASLFPCGGRRAKGTSQPLGSL